MAARPGCPSPTASSRPLRWARSRWPIPTPTSSTPAWAKPACAATPPTATASTSPPMAARRGATSASRTPITSARCACIPRIPTSSTSRRWATCGGRTKSAASIRSTDGGATWKQVLTRGPDAGAVDLAHGSRQSARALRQLLAGAAATRTISTAAGRAAACGSPPTAATPGPTSRALRACRSGVLGRIGVTVSPANPERVWAIVEAADGGVFRSDNGGRTWTKVNDQNILRQRAWYYSHIFADPQNADTVYALNTGMYRSIDGGRTFAADPHAARRQPRPVDRARQSAAHDRKQRRRRQHHHRRRPHLVHAS